MALGSDFQLTIECKMRLRSSNRWFHWTYGISLQLGIPLPLCPMGENIIFGIDQKLGFCLVIHMAIFAMGGQK
jgi:hypothetical protein